MKYLYQFLFSLVLGIIFVMASLATPAYACTPPPGGPLYFSPAERALAAEVVLEGTIIAVVVDTSTMLEIATVEVHRYFKADGPETVTIAPFGPSSLCLTPVSVGQRLIFYAKGDPATGLEAQYLSAGDAVSPATPEVIGEIIAALGLGPKLYLPIIFKL